MEKPHLNLCHMSLILDNRLCVIFYTFIHNFIGNVQILKNS